MFETNSSDSYETKKRKANITDNMNIFKETKNVYQPYGMEPANCSIHRDNNNIQTKTNKSQKELNSTILALK
jgi:hypothetical protein